MMQALVGGGAHLDFRNSQALTAIHRAALNCNPESLKVLSLVNVVINYQRSSSIVCIVISLTVWPFWGFVGCFRPTV